MPAPIFKAVRSQWHDPDDRVKAFDVIWCESRYSLRAENGQYLGLFQMGYGERRRCGHGASARIQAAAAYCWWKLTGWYSWGCA